MTAIHKLYMQEMREQFDYFACWLPSTRVKLGDVGVFLDQRYEKVTTLADLSVDFRVGEPHHRANMEHTSNGAVTVSAGAEAGLAVANPLATMTFNFSRQGATFFQASDCVEESIEDLPSVEASLQKLCAAKTWRRDYVVITRLVRTGPTAILVSKDSDTRVDLKVDADGLGTPLPVATAASRLAVTASSGMAASVLAPDGATPLFRASRMRRRLLGGRELVFRDNSTTDFELVELGWDELAEER